MDKYKFGNFIYERRKKLNLTQDELGRKLGVTNKAVSKWETGETLPDIVILESLAKILECSIDELLTQQPYESNVEKKQKKNFKISFIVNVISFFLLMISLIFIIFFSIKNQNDINDNDLTLYNFKKYLNYEKLYKFETKSENEFELISSLEVDENYEPLSDIKVNAEITVHLSYLDSNGDINYFSFLEKEIEYTIPQDSRQTFGKLSLKPSFNLDFKGLLSLSVEYQLTEVYGSFKEIKQ